MSDPRLTSPLLVVIRADQEPLTVQTNNMDLVLWDRTRVKQRWPRMDEAPFLWFTFLSWSAARRTGEIDQAMTYEAWESSVLDISPVDDDEPGADIGRPTFGVVAPG